MRIACSAGVFLLLLVSVGAPRAFAERQTATDSSAEVNLLVSASAPAHVTLQIGSKGATIDTVHFNVTSTPEQQPVIIGDIAPAVDIKTNNNAGVVLTADSSGGLTSGAATMPFSVISWEGTGEFAGSRGTFDGSSNQLVMSFGNNGNWNGSFRYTYGNSYNHPPGSYQGTITYTCTAP